MSLLYFLISFILFEYSNGVFEDAKYNIFDGHRIIKIDSCNRYTCRMYGVAIEKDVLSPHKTMPENLDADLNDHLNNTTQNYFSLMNYVSLYSNPAVGNGKWTNNTQNIMRTLRFVQWSINIPITTLIEKLMINVIDDQNKDGFYIFLLKFFKITNGDVLFYCKFVSLDNCVAMYSGVNVNIVTNNIYYGDCVEMPPSSIQQERKFMYFCNENITKTSRDIIRYLTKLQTSDVYSDSLLVRRIKTLKQKSNKLSSHITADSLMSELFDNVNKTITTQQSWTQMEDYLMFLCSIISEFNVNIIDVVLDKQEQAYSLSLGNVHITNSKYHQLNILIKMLCLHDVSTCGLDDLTMNVNVNTDYIYYMPIRIDTSTIEKNLIKILNIEKINVKNLIFKQTFTPITKLQHNNESISHIDVPPSIRYGGFSINAKHLEYFIIISIIIFVGNCSIVIFYLSKCNCNKEKKVDDNVSRIVDEHLLPTKTTVPVNIVKHSVSFCNQNEDDAQTFVTQAETHSHHKYETINNDHYTELLPIVKTPLKTPPLSKTASITSYDSSNYMQMLQPLSKRPHYMAQKQLAIEEDDKRNGIFVDSMTILNDIIDEMSPFSNAVTSHSPSPSSHHHQHHLMLEQLPTLIPPQKPQRSITPINSPIMRRQHYSGISIENDYMNHDIISLNDNKILSSILPQQKITYYPTIYSFQMKR